MAKNYEMIICIVNAGYSGLVMDAAREVGATGGTVLKARGTANKEAEEFFHITIQPEKDAMILVVPANIKDAVLKAIYKKAGMNTPGQGIAFSVTINNTIGIDDHKTPVDKKENKTSE